MTGDLIMLPEHVSLIVLPVHQQIGAVVVLAGGGVVVGCALVLRKAGDLSFRGRRVDDRLHFADRAGGKTRLFSVLADQIL